VLVRTVEAWGNIHQPHRLHHVHLGIPREHLWDFLAHEGGIAAAWGMTERAAWGTSWVVLVDEERTLGYLLGT